MIAAVTANLSEKAFNGCELFPVKIVTVGRIAWLYVKVRVIPKTAMPRV